MRDKLIAAGVKNLREFGYPQCTKDNKGKAGADVDAVIDALIAECSSNIPREPLAPTGSGND